MKLSFLFACALFATACGSQTPGDTTPPVTPAPIEETEAAADPAEAEQPTAEEAEAPADVDAESETSAAEAPAAFTVSVVKHEKGAEGPPKGPVNVSATPGTNQVTVELGNFAHTCEPAPTFTAAAEGEQLVLQIVKPAASATSKCVSAHSVTVSIALPGRNNLRKVVVKGQRGKPMGVATITSTP